MLPEDKDGSMQGGAAWATEREVAMPWFLEFFSGVGAQAGSRRGSG